VGFAHHTFLQWLEVTRAGDLPSLRTEAQRLIAEGVLASEEAAALNLEAIAAFWNSRLGQDLWQKQDCLRRELPFTFRVPADLLSALLGEPSEPGLENEFVVVQGVADLVCVLANELWIVDFKTDAVQPRDLSSKTRLYTPQLKLYAIALSAIYSRPVTRCSLYFLSCERQVDVAVGNTLPTKPRRKKPTAEKTLELGL
jgi:ATP-dependent helicase/nuclease subunit A